MRLTWPNESYPVTIESVIQKQQFAGEVDIEIHCRTPQNWYGNSGGGFGFGSVNGVGVADMCAQWIRRAFFGEMAGPEARGIDMTDMFSRPEGPSLPEVLSASGVVGWQAEGVSLLYAIEEAARSRGARFPVLHAGPATASGIRLRGRLSIDQNGTRAEINVDGIVPLSKRTL
jgi:hypothetical protein